MLDLTQTTLTEDGKVATYQAQVDKRKKDEKTGKMVSYKGIEERNMDLRRIFKHALLVDMGKFSLSYQGKRYNLYTKIRDNDEVSLSWFEKRLLRKLISRAFDVVVCGQMAEVLK